MKGTLDRYLLFHTLKAETVDWYRRIVSVYCTWAGGDVPIDHFTGESISQMLLDKERAGRSPYYLKSLRGGLVALLGELRGSATRERVRTIKTPPLDPQGLLPEEVEKLLKACHALPAHRRVLFRLMIALGYYTGLDACDIWKLERRHIGRGGEIFFRRGKTGSPVFVKIPQALVDEIDAHCPKRGPLIRLGVGRERFRQVMATLFTAAGLSGTFKTIRKTSGSLVEQATPGTGHKHLGNTRAIFEKHYDVKKLTRAVPTMPPPVGL